MLPQGCRLFIKNTSGVAPGVILKTFQAGAARHRSQARLLPSASDNLAAVYFADERARSLPPSLQLPFVEATGLRRSSSLDCARRQLRPCHQRLWLPLQDASQAEFMEARTKLKSVGIFVEKFFSPMYGCQDTHGDTSFRKHCIFYAMDDSSVQNVKDGKADGLIKGHKNSISFRAVRLPQHCSALFLTAIAVTILKYLRRRRTCTHNQTRPMPVPPLFIRWPAPCKLSRREKLLKKLPRIVLVTFALCTIAGVHPLQLLQLRGLALLGLIASQPINGPAVYALRCRKTDFSHTRPPLHLCLLPVGWWLALTLVRLALRIGAWALTPLTAGPLAAAARSARGCAGNPLRPVTRGRERGFSTAGAPTQTGMRSAHAAPLLVRGLVKAILGGAMQLLRGTIKSPHALGCLLLLLFVSPAAAGPTETPPSGAMGAGVALAIVSFNVTRTLWSNLPLIKEWVKEEDPDFVFLADGGRLPAGMTAEKLGACFRNHSVMTSAPAPKEGHFSPKLVLIFKDKWKPYLRDTVAWKGRAISTSLHFKGKTTHIHGVYGPLAGRNKWWSRWTKKVFEPRAPAAGSRSIVIGDLNAILDERDKSSSSLNHAKVLAINALLNNSKLIDLGKHKQPRKKLRTFFADREHNGQVEHYSSYLDHCLVSPALAPCSTFAILDHTDFTNDHKPIRAVVTMERDKKGPPKHPQKQVKIERIDPSGWHNAARVAAFQEKCKSELPRILEGAPPTHAERITTLLVASAKASIGMVRVSPTAAEELGLPVKFKPRREAVKCAKRALAARHKCKTGKMPPRQVQEAATRFAAELGPFPLQQPAMSGWFQLLASALKREQATLQRELKAHTKKRIRRAIDKLNENQLCNPRAFFDSLRLDKSRNNQGQRQTIRRVGGKEVIVDDEEEVKRDIRVTWMEIFTSRIRAFPLPSWLKPKILHRFRTALGRPSAVLNLSARITIEELIDAPLSLQTAPGRSGLTNECIKHAPLEVKQELVKIMNRILDGGRAPDSWRFCIIKPVPKPGGNPAKADDYRPIALLETLYKLYIAILIRRVNKELEDAGCISDAQAGFRENHGAANKLLEITSEIRTRRARNEPIFLLFVDLKKAYDSVEHHVLFSTLKAMGVPPLITASLEELYRDNECGVQTAWGLATHSLCLEVSDKAVRPLPRSSTWSWNHWSAGRATNWTKNMPARGKSARPRY